MLGGTALLAQTRGGSVSYVLPDGQGSVRQLANSVGTITDTYRYDAYGNVLSHSGSTTLPYGYDGQRLDATSGLYQLRARSYDPTTGRFTTPDTAALSPTDVAELDRYVYAGANPINMSDPSGHNFLEYALQAAVSVGGAYFAAVDLGESLALLFTEGAIDEAAAAAGADTAVVWVGTVLRAVWDVYHLVTDLSTFVHDLQQIYQAFLAMFTSGLGPGGSGSGSSGGGTGAGGGGGSGTRLVVIVTLSRKAFPQSTQHIDDARTLKHKPAILTLARAGRLQRRRQCLASSGLPPNPKFQRDEYPPAISLEGGRGCDVRYVDPKDNEGAGTSMGNQLRPYPYDVTLFYILLVP